MIVLAQNESLLQILTRSRVSLKPCLIGHKNDSEKRSFSRKHYCCVLVTRKEKCELVQSVLNLWKK